jgi:hypothetical protein
MQLRMHGSKFRVTEVSESGSVPQLLAFNETSSQVFLLDGEGDGIVLAYAILLQ